MPEGGAPGERARGIEEELRRLGYLEGRVDRFLERGGGGVGGCVTRALRVGGAGGPLLALLLLAFHATADPLLLTEPSRALLLLVLLVAGEI
ncbi:MAG: hypothetical protein ACE5GW_11705, partial [Planctomycetota bacterium]